MRRRAHIEFTSRNTIQVTNFCNQKSFDLDKMNSGNMIIDLVTLCYRSHKEADNTPFFAQVDHMEEYDDNGRLYKPGSLENPYYVVVCARTKEDAWGEVIGHLTTRSREDTFFVNVP